MGSLLNQSEHVEHWDKRLVWGDGRWEAAEVVVVVVKMGMESSMAAADREESLRENPPSRQNSSKGLEEVKPT